MAVAGAAYRIGTEAAQLQIEAWSKTIHRALHEKMKFVPGIKKYEKLYGRIHIRKLSPLGINALGNNDDGTGLTYSANTEVDVELQPAAQYCAVAIPRNMRGRVDFSPKSVFTKGVMESMKEGVDIDVLEDCASAVNFIGDNTVQLSAAEFRYGVGQLMINTDGAVEPGSTLIRALMHPAQYNNVISIPEFTNADVRGGGDTPNVKGIFSKGGGVNMQFSNAVYVDVDLTAHNPLWVEEAYGISWNDETGVEYQVEELQDRVIAYNDYGHGIVRDEFTFILRTSSVAPTPAP